MNTTKGEIRKSLYASTSYEEIGIDRNLASLDDSDPDGAEPPAPLFGFVPANRTSTFSRSMANLQKATAFRVNLKLRDSQEMKPAPPSEPYNPSEDPSHAR